MSNRPVRIQKRLLQFNGVPFAFSEISDVEYAISTKGESQPYTNNTHGSYFPTLGESAKLEASTLRATIDFDFRKISCEDKIRYARFIKRQLLISGKLWAVQNAVELLWTNARVVDITESVDDPGTRDMFRMNITFELPDGYWRMAKPTRTFLCEYCPNRFEDYDPEYCNDMYDYYGVCDESGIGNCMPCDLNLERKPIFDGCYWQPLCYYPLYNPRKATRRNPNDVSSTIQEIVPARYDMFGVNCANQYYIKYDCALEKERFCYDAGWGRKFNIDTTQAGKPYTFHYCSRTDLPTDKIKIRLVGKFTNPKVWINGDYVEVEQVVDDMLVIGFGPTAYVTTDEKDLDPEQRYSVQNYMKRSNTPAFEVHAGKNCVTIEGANFGENALIYLDTVDITW